MMSKNIIFDFNGTIVDDVDLSIASLNSITTKYLNKEFNLESYRKIFTFPIIDYYRNAGFDFKVKTFEELGYGWYNYYHSHINEARLFDSVIPLLKYNKEHNIKNVIISSSEQNDLINHLKLLGIAEYFDEILGISDIWGGGKIEIAKKFMEDKNPDNWLLVGDTLHDKSVADEIGVECYLVTCGHQAKQDLLETGCKVIKDVGELYEGY